MEPDELAACLRSWRERLSPADAGLPAGTSRRTPGLRREEVAHLAGLSVDYLARLEQGRAKSPSPSVLAPLARALRLSDSERDHLFRVAGQAPPEPGGMRRHLTPSIQRLLDRLAGTPVIVTDAAAEIVAWNPFAAALLGDLSALSPRERNHAWTLFVAGGGVVELDAAERQRIEHEVVADLHEAVGRFPTDERLQTLVADLRDTSPRFEELWLRRPVARREASHKVIRHPTVGRITLDCDTLSVSGSDLRLVVYSAVPGSPDEAALEMVGALGLQTFV